MIRFIPCIALLLALGARAATDSADHLVPLIDPAKMTTLGTRGANPRIQKCVYWLEVSRQAGEAPDKVAAEAIARWLTPTTRPRPSPKQPFSATSTSPTIRMPRRGRHGWNASRQITNRQTRALRGYELSVDHIIPRSVVPELDNVIANLELLPLKLN